MDFARPQALLLLLLLPAALLLAHRARSRRLRAWSELGRPGRLPSTRPVRYYVASVILIIALAGPRIGRAPGSELPPGHDVVLLIDDSRSMATEDTVPDRFSAAIAAAEGLLNELRREPGARVAVVGFAGNAELLCPLTERIDAARDALHALRPGDVQPGGSDLGGALLAAIDAFEPQERSEGRSIVVLSDGEDLTGSWHSLLPRLWNAKVIIHGVTFGDDRTGHPIPVGDRREPLTYRGQIVKSRRSDEALSEISRETGGSFVPAGVSRVEVASLYRDRIGPSERRRHAALTTPERVDRSSFLIAGALGLLGSAGWPRSRRLGAVVVLLAIGAGASPVYRTARDAVAAGDAAYRAGDAEKALDAFLSAIRLDRDSPIPEYDAGAALYQLRRYEEAEGHYLAAREKSDPVLRAKIDYALGNVAVATGRYKEALARYDECLAATAEGPGISALKRDAQANRRFAERLIPPPASPDAEGNRRTPESNRPGEAPPREEENPQPKDTPPPPEAPNSPASPQGEVPKGGGTGGARRPGESGSREESPESRLDAMLDEVRKAQGASRESTSASGPAKTDRKDW